MTVLSRVYRRESVCTEVAGKTAADNTDTGKTSCTITGAGGVMSVEMLGIEVAAVGTND